MSDPRQARKVYLEAAHLGIRRARASADDLLRTIEETRRLIQASRDLLSRLKAAELRT